MKKLLGIGDVVSVDLGGAIGIKQCKVINFKKSHIEVKTYPQGRKVHQVQQAAIDLSTAAQV